MNEALRRVPRQRRSRERVERILDAAAVIFGEVGYDVATTHLIAERAGTAVGTLYQFFPDKRALFRALEERHMARVVEFQARMLTPQLTEMSLEKMCAHLVEMSADFLSEPTARVMYLLYHATPQLFEQFDEDFIAQMINSAAMLMRSRNPAMSDETLDVVAEVFIRTFNHVLVVALRNPEERRRQLVRELEILLVSYLRTYDRPTVGTASAVEALSTLSERRRTALSTAVRSGSLTVRQLEQLFPTHSRRTLQRDLNFLVKQGWLFPLGDTNHHHYRPTTQLHETCANL